MDYGLRGKRNDYRYTIKIPRDWNRQHDWHVSFTLVRNYKPTTEHGIPAYWNNRGVNYTIPTNTKTKEVLI